MAEKIIVIATHPDDETLGCGGTLLRYKSLGHEIYWLIMTSMHADQGFSEEVIDRRLQEISTVKKMYDFDGVYSLDFPASKLSEIKESLLISKIYEVFKKIQPTQIILPYFQDVHSDHRHAFSAVYSCTKIFRFPSISKIMMMETLSETEFCNSATGAFSPNTFVDVSGFMEKKIKILNTYHGEIGTHPFPRSERSVFALATLRGATAGVEYAEAYMLLKEII
jgi:LmbE family N-acetylglucosaminyl deacetylase